MFPSLAATLPEYGVEVNAYFMVVFDFCDGSWPTKDAQAIIAMVDDASNLDPVFHVRQYRGNAGECQALIFWETTG